MANIFTDIGNFFISPFLKISLNRKIDQLKAGIEEKEADGFIETLLGALSIVFRIDKEFHKNIDGFTARYVFKDKSGGVAASAIFANGVMEMKPSAVADATVTVVFDKGKSMCDLLLSPDPNIFDFILDGRLSYTGNLNYLLKLAYMAKHLQKQFAF
jgi:hypothetical protein